MKITPRDFQVVKTMLERSIVDTPANREAYIKAGLSSKRYRWDCFRLSGGISFLCNELYAYMNDDHMDTALRKLIPDLE